MSFNFKIENNISYKDMYISTSGNTYSKSNLFWIVIVNLANALGLDVFDRANVAFAMKKSYTEKVRAYQKLSCEKEINQEKNVNLKPLEKELTECALNIKKLRVLIKPTDSINEINGTHQYFGDMERINPFISPAQQA